jgi:Flp pilus assembly protein TadG
VIRSYRRSNRKGQGLVEFALVAPIFILALLTLIEFGRAVYYVQTLQNAAREGARYAMVHGSASLCPSGPMPTNTPNLCDPTGAKVAEAVKARAIGVIDNAAAAFNVDVKWCKPSTECPNTNVVGKGDGSNDRAQTVRVRITYSFSSFLSTVFPIPSFTLSGESRLVINH